MPPTRSRRGLRSCSRRPRNASAMAASSPIRDQIRPAARRRGCRVWSRRARPGCASPSDRRGRRSSVHAQPTPPSRKATRSCREAPGHPAEEQRLAHRLARRGEVADVVVHEVRRRGPQPVAPAAGVERRCHAELDAARPDRVVVVGAVEAEGVEPAEAPTPARRSRSTARSPSGRGIRLPIIDRLQCRARRPRGRARRSPPRECASGSPRPGVMPVGERREHLR